MKRKAGSSRRAMDHKPSRHTCRRRDVSAEHQGCRKSTRDRKGPNRSATPSPPTPGLGSLSSQTIQLGGRSEGQGSNTHRAGSPDTSDHRALGCHPRGSGGPGSQQGSPRGQIWMSAPSPPTETFLSKHRPGGQAAEPLPFPQTDGSVAPTEPATAPA